MPRYTSGLRPAINLERGDGVHDRAGILHAAHAAGIRRIFAERAPSFTAPRLESARQSFEFLKGLQA